MVASPPQHRELRDAVCDFVLYNAQWIVEKNGYLSPAHGVARRDLNQARRVRQTCVGTGCATV